jgi:hypothetical protein
MHLSSEQERGTDPAIREHEDGERNEHKDDSKPKCPSLSSRSDVASPVISQEPDPEVEHDPQTCTDPTCNNFEIFVRECAGPANPDPGDAGKGNSGARSNQWDLLGPERGSPHRKKPARAKLKQRGGRCWRWFKLVPKRHDPRPSQDELDAAFLEPSETSHQQEGDEGRLPGRNRGKQKQTKHQSGSSTRSGHTAEASGESRSPGRPRGARQSPQLTEELVESMEPRTPRPNENVRFQDAFGHGVLVDEEEMQASPSPARQSSGSATPNRRRRTRSQRLRQFGRREIGTSIEPSPIPREAILPIVQNDGSASISQEWSRVYRVCPCIFARLLACG